MKTLSFLTMTKAPALALLDQAIVSTGSFLTIALTAHLLTADEQGKYGYVLSVYLATIIFNTTLIFQWASVNTPKVVNTAKYLRDLAMAQLVLAFILALLLGASVWLLGAASGWHLSIGELLLVFCYLVLQQLSDFGRRTAYFSESQLSAWKQSAIVQAPRLAALLIVRPDNISDVLVILAITALPLALWRFRSVFQQRPSIAFLLSFLNAQPRQAKWLMASGPLVWLSSSMPIFIGGFILSLHAVGVFITVRSLTNGVNVLMELLETEVSASAGRLYVEDIHAFWGLYNRLLIYGAAIWTIGAFIFYVYGAIILSSIFGSAYSAYGNVLDMLWLAVGIYYVFRLRAVMARTNNSSHAVTLAYLAHVLTTILFGILLIEHYQIVGISMTICISSAAALLSMLLLTTKQASQIIK